MAGKVSDVKRLEGIRCVRNRLSVEGLVGLRYTLLAYVYVYRRSDRLTPLRVGLLGVE